MPHCQKETHDHTAKSKQERKAKKALVLSRKKAAKQKATEDELEKQKNLKNNLALADGFGEYEVGCEEEKEYVAKFNLNKRSKKHLRIDIRKAQEKKEEEEEERRREEEQEKYRLRQEQEQEQEQLRKRLEQEEKEGRCYPASEKQLELELELEPPPIVEEYLVYVCQCCHKKFNTTNQFINHSKSKKHRDNARLYEEAGVIVTDVKLRSDFDDDDNDNYEDDGDYEDGNSDYEDGVVNGSNRGSDDDELDDDDNNNDEEDSEEEEYYEEPPKRGNTFSAFAGFGDSDSSSSDSDSSDGENSEDEDEKDDQVKELPSDVIGNQEEKENGEDEDDLDLLEEIIYQNRLQDRFYGDYCDDDGGDENENDDDDKATDAVVPIPFDDDQYNPDYYTADENRLVSVQHRLQKRLASKGIAPSNINPGSRTSDAVSMGKTLLQQIMAASIETLEAKLEAYKQHKAEYQLLGRDFRFAKGNSKALASQYTFRIDPSNNARRRENIHHTGSHYHMQAARSMQHGRQKGLMARHSSQGSRLQASRIAAKEMQRVHVKGMKVGKTSKKSNQKRRGEAGGSKKSGGTSSEK